MVEYPWRPLGELLVERGLIDEYQLESLLLEQRLSGKLFGELLVCQRVVSPMDMAAVIAEQHGSISPPSTPSRQRGLENGASGIRSAASSSTRRLLTESGLQRVLLAQQRTGVIARAAAARARLRDAGAARRGAGRAAWRRDPSPEAASPAERSRRSRTSSTRSALPGTASGALHVIAVVPRRQRLRLRAALRRGSRRARDRRGEGRAATDRLVVRAAADGRLAETRLAALARPRATASRPASICSGSAKNPWNMPS